MTPTKRRCDGITEGGAPCLATPMSDSVYCFWHDPETQQQAAEARRLGGQRRRREAVVAATFGVEGLETVPQVRRLLEVAVGDTLSLENSVARNRTLAYLVQMALKALEVGELADRLAAIEAVLMPRIARERRR
jgi:hypothetical protein